MKKYRHEVKDPIHAFIQFDEDERKIINSLPFQRLRNIHQLSLSFMVYPGATHRRFEHSLGVMELAGRVFDVITSPYKISDEVRGLFSDCDVDLNDNSVLNYWKKTLRIAALCHDMGHLPFSHAAEDKLLPVEWDHERMTREIIEKSEIKNILENEVSLVIKPEHVVKLAIGPKKAKDLEFNDWEILLSEVIVGDAFGVDRMDYLLRDSHHSGLVHGKFDHYRLIDTLRIVTPPAETDNGEKSKEPSLGVEEGGLVTSEALLLSRYFMFSQVYFHPVTKIYDLHLTDFLVENRNGQLFPTIPVDYMMITDNEIMMNMYNAASNKDEKGHKHAKRIIGRDHLRVFYQRYPSDLSRNKNAVKNVFNAMRNKYGEDFVRYYHMPAKGKPASFLVYQNDDRADYALNLSKVIENIPTPENEVVYIDKSIKDEAKKWLAKDRENLINFELEEEDADK
ncbi:MAG: phosphohydrolase [candidate division Zixibacteria bacterium HGW-Zixibacteria-1]|nr:MAG: phosphohydrolase [candidate division Zixibacteria bacterium HGW-Zixibacteria-1]